MYNIYPCKFDNEAMLKVRRTGRWRQNNEYHCSSNILHSLLWRWIVNTTLLLLIVFYFGFNPKFKALSEATIVFLRNKYSLLKLYSKSFALLAHIFIYNHIFFSWNTTIRCIVCDFSGLTKYWIRIDLAFRVLLWNHLKKKTVYF